MKLEYDITVLPPPPADARVVAQLERLLEQAKGGQLRAFISAEVYQTPGHAGLETAVTQVGKCNIASMVLALERAKLRAIGFVEDIDIDWDSSVLR